MIIIIDTSILISALIRDSITRKIIVLSGLNFYYPESSAHELRKHESLILKKSGMSQQSYEKLLNKLFGYIAFVPEDEINEKLDEAKRIMSGIDPSDAIFIAAALAYPDSIIWSDDRHFEKQKRITSVKTGQLIRMFYRSGKCI